jgi:hypothetical protein
MSTAWWAARSRIILALAALFYMLSAVWADDETSFGVEADLTQDLTNPLADLMTIPMNYDHDIGADDKGERLRINIQPVIPFHLNEDWKLISRTIVPLINQEDISNIFLQPFVSYT